MSPEKSPVRPLCLAALALGATALLAGAPLAAPSSGKKPPSTAATKSAAKSLVKAARPLTEDEKIVHVLDRLGYGPRPGDVERVKAMGLTQYIDAQLHPERVPDAAVESRLASFTEMNLSADDLAAKYQDLLQSARQAKGLRKQQKQAGAAQAAANPAGQDPAMDPAALGAGRRARKGAQLNPAGQPDAGSTGADAAAPTPARKRPNRLAQMDPAARREARQARQAAAQTAAPVAMAHEEFMAAKALRAVESERQLQEVLVDFWSNHFNIDIRRPPCGILKIVDDRDAIRPHVFGKFRDLLGASAHSPAMLVYLDNFQSMTETPAAAPRARRAGAARRAQLAAGGAAPATPVTPAAPPKAKKRPMGLNENYGREIMELHTLGVDGGYTQQDVREVARCFTGWSIASSGGRRPGAGKYAGAGVFHFYSAMHDDGQKTVLGHVIPAGGGEQDGEKVLDILASSPATMRHVSTELCMRLVADDPPKSLVDRCVATWQRTDGDLREIVRTIVTSPEFYSLAAFRTKIKSPFEYAVSSVRALGGSFDVSAALANASQPRKAISLIKPPKGGGYLDLDTVSLIGQVGTMGEPLFQYQAPTGYPEDLRKWVSSGALISRLNFALALTAGKLGDIKLPAPEGTAGGDAERSIDRMAGQVLHRPISAATRATLLAQVRLASDGSSGAAGPATRGRVAALLLGSPEFQRH